MLDHPRVLAPPPLVFVAGILLGLLFDWFWPLRFRSLWLGGILVALGIVLGALGQVEFNRHGTNPQPWRPAKKLLTSGIYSYTRNPLYLSMALVHAGIAFLLGRLWVLVMLVPAMIAINFLVVRREEEYLKERFGEEYGRYMQQVRRYL